MMVGTLARPSRLGTVRMSVGPREWWVNGMRLRPGNSLFMRSDASEKRPSRVMRLCHGVCHVVDSDQQAMRRGFSRPLDD